MTTFGLIALVFLAAALPEVATAIPAPWNHIVLGVATGCVAVKALLTNKPTNGEPQPVNVVNPPEDPANVAEVPKP